MKRELDVYHSVLSLELGSQPLYLHYGLMSENNSIFQKQQLSTDLVIEHLIEGQNLLEVGGGIGYTAKQLRDIGYNVTSIDKRAYPNSLGVVTADFNTMHLNSEYYDIILFQESAQYFEDDFETPFNKCWDALKFKGQLLVLDEFSTDFLNSCPIPFYNAIDLTGLAAPSVEFLVNIIKKHKKALLKNFSEDELTQLIYELNYRILQYKSNKYKYMLIDIRKDM
jgi:ubiquinone/menaquinone biosynthesis C-methylase UbiE